jgi:glycosyltransferase involved in cell wall biosynthesis
MAKDQEIVDVVIIGEGAFPYVRGGVSGVMNQMFRGLPDLTFGVIAIAWDRKDTGRVRYEIPPNVLWVKDIYLSPEELTGSTRIQRTMERIQRALAPCLCVPKENTSLAQGLFKDLRAAVTGDYSGLMHIYRDLLDPGTRLYSPGRVFRSSEFLIEFEEHCARGSIPLAEAFWVWTNFISAVTRIACQRLPDARVYHAHTQLYAGLAAAVAAIQNDRPFVLTEHSLNIRDSVNFVARSDMRESKKALWDAWFRHLGRFVYSQVDDATYQFERNVIEASELGLDRGKVTMISNGISMADFARARARRDTEIMERKERGWNRIPWRLAYIGRIVEAKGILDLIEAVRTLKNLGQFPFHLQLVGPHEGSQSFVRRCGRMIRRLGLEDHVSFPGTLDLTEALGEIDMMILPSHADALPIVMLEAMASSVPVIATDVGAIDEVLRGPVYDHRESHDHSREVGAAGIVIPPHSPGSIADAIARLAGDMAFYESCKRDGPRRIEVNHLAEDIMGKYVNLYKRACFRQKKRYSGKEVTRRAWATTMGRPIKPARHVPRQNASKPTSRGLAKPFSSTDENRIDPVNCRNEARPALNMDK